jgi:hypothetical protein
MTVCGFFSLTSSTGRSWPARSAVTLMVARAATGRSRCSTTRGCPSVTCNHRYSVITHDQEQHQPGLSFRHLQSQIYRDYPRPGAAPPAAALPSPAIIDIQSLLTTRCSTTRGCPSVTCNQRYTEITHEQVQHHPRLPYRHLQSQIYRDYPRPGAAPPAAALPSPAIRDIQSLLTTRCSTTGGCPSVTCNQRYTELTHDQVQHHPRLPFRHLQSEIYRAYSRPGAAPPAAALPSPAIRDIQSLLTTRCSTTRGCPSVTCNQRYTEITHEQVQHHPRLPFRHLQSEKYRDNPRPLLFGVAQVIF